MYLTHVHQQGFDQEDKEPNTHTEQSFKFGPHPDNMRRSNDDSQVVVRFDRFGAGQNPRNYEVVVNWSDLKSLLEKFVEAKHEHAEHLLRILKMARSLGDAGWHNGGEPPEFWENLLET
ncbi:hypothetical protein J6500_22135 [Bradyrhizobium sp. WSM 1704]|uniref:hypothetical protein n=1 Tax=Bradyrhizobium semiaridum TaxID=2821404 RepID=UPI001CE3A590|nr:hypothetical protein [Bradyrhizobium semiaridum]MCA6124571.1 hypothetical protein [Bradyrhizobium semiaridum]